MQALVPHLSKIKTSNNVEAALQNSDWKAAVFDEMNALNKNGTWEIVNQPSGKSPVVCKWVFTVKYKVDGTVERYKGYTQTYKIDYQETFALVAKINTIRVLLSLEHLQQWSKSKKIDAQTKKPVSSSGVILQAKGLLVNSCHQYFGKYCWELFTSNIGYMMKISILGME